MSFFGKKFFRIGRNVLDNIAGAYGVPLGELRGTTSDPNTKLTVTTPAGKTVQIGEGNPKPVMTYVLIAGLVLIGFVSMSKK